jgi:hypothetical protein
LNYALKPIWSTPLLSNAPRLATFLDSGDFLCPFSNLVEIITPAGHPTSTRTTDLSRIEQVTIATLGCMTNTRQLVSINIMRSTRYFGRTSDTDMDNSSVHKCDLTRERKPSGQNWQPYSGRAPAALITSIGQVTTIMNLNWPLYNETTASVPQGHRR